MDDEDRAEEWQRLADELAAAQDVDSKTSALTSIQHELTAAATSSDSSASLFISPLKPCLKSSNFHVFSLALGLVPLIVRLLDTASHDGQRSVHAAVVHLTPPTLERAGDARERVREAALKALIEIGKIALVGAPPPSLNSSRGHSSGDTPLSIYESLITSSGLLAKSPRIREQACRLLTALRSHSSTRFPIKPFLPGLVDLLADADGACREAAKATLVALFASASAPAKADLKREMEVKGVRKPLADGILRDVIGGGAEAAEEQLQHASTASSTTSSTATAPSSAPTSTVPAAPVPPVYLASPRDLSTTLSTLLPYFDGKETEHNWAKRESSIIKLRGILKSSPNHQLAEALAAETRHWAEPIMKAVASLRTTLAIHGIALVAEIATGLPYPTYSLPEAAIDVLLPGLLRMAGFTKRLVANSSQIAASALLRNVAYRPKFMGWLWAGMADKTVSTRTAMVEHLHTLLVCVKPVGMLEQHDGVGIMCQFLSKGLADQNPEVRQKSREAFYVFRRVWVQQAEGVMEKLDAAVRKQVTNGLAAAEAAHAAAGPASAFSSPRKAAVTPSATSRSAPSSMDSTPGSPAVPQPPPGKFVPSRRPGGATGGPGPSSAIVAAKRAAAAKMAEMRRQEAAAAAAAAAEAEAAERGDHEEEQEDETIAGAREPDDDPGDTSVGDSTRGGGSDEGDATPTRAPPSQLSSSSSRRDDDDDANPRSSDRLSSGIATSRFLSRHVLDNNDEDEDDTVQLGGPSSARRRTGNEEDGEDDSVADFDASVTMDLMAAPVELPVRRSNGGGRAQPPAPAARGNAAQDSSSSSRRASSEASASAATPPHSSSRLPRPVSMMMGSPSPSAPRQQPNVISSLQTQSQAASAAPSTPAALAPSAPSGQGWFLNRAARLSLADDGSASSPLKSKPDSLAWVEEVRSRRADVKIFRQLAKLSAQFRVEHRGAGRRAGGADGAGIQLGRLGEGGSGRATGKERLQDEVDDPSSETDEEDPTALSATQRQQTEAWREGHLFELLFSALEAWFHPTTLPPPPEASSNAAAQVLLHRLVENQFALFPALGLEGRLLRVALYGTGGEGAEAAAKAILTAWATRTVPAVGLAVLRAEGEKAFTSSSSDIASEHGTAIARLLALTCLAHLFSRLPRSVVFEDELPRVSAWVLWAINDTGSVKARQEGVKVLVAAVRGQDGEEGMEVDGEGGEEAVGEKLRKALGEGLKREQVDLVLYYVAKRGAA